MSRVKNDYNMKRLAQSLQRFIRYLNEPGEPVYFEGEQVDKVAVFKDMIEQSESKQIVFSVKRDYKVFGDLSIQMPFAFEEEVLDEFVEGLVAEQQQMMMGY